MTYILYCHVLFSTNPRNWISEHIGTKCPKLWLYTFLYYVSTIVIGLDSDYNFSKCFGLVL